MTASSSSSSTSPTPARGGLVPRLRFPEFGRHSGWKNKRLGDLLSVGNGKDYKHLGRGNIPVYGSGGYMLSVDAFLYDGDSVCIGRKGTIDNPMFLKGKFWTVDTLFYTHSFRDFLPKFAFLTFQNINWLKHNEAGGVPSLQKSNIVKISVPVPTLPEQQKIADCLSSLDDLITAESEKLETLKEHKKGLMQELFPQEGETVPRIRFPEFEGSGAWEVKRLGDLLVKAPDYGVNAPSVPFSPELPAYLRITDIDMEGNLLRNGRTSVNVAVTSQNVLKNGDIVVARTGASVGKSYQYKPTDGQLVFAGFLIRLSPDPAKLDSTFIANYMTSRRYWSWVSVTSVRSGQPGINAEEYSSFTVPLPPTLSEQNRIASILSSLDDRITAQTERIETLKEHKKGLMQQLFPVMEG